MSGLPYRLGKSLIHGRGVIATRFIAAGTELPMPTPMLDESLFSDEGGYVFPGFNHSCNNNLDSRGANDTRKVLRDIQPGEEITVDYGLPVSKRHLCNCEVCRETRK